MVKTQLPVLLLLALLLVGKANVAGAQQVFESVGERALGMAGAFVAVADDSTAAHWNPAGLVGGSAAGMTIGWNRFHFGNQDGLPEPGMSRRTSSLTSLGTWPIGVSYGRFQTTGFAAGPGPDPIGETLRVRHYAVTILQSIVHGLVVGSTVKYLRGGVARAPVSQGTASEALAATADLKTPSRGAFDLDLGVMADMRRLRVGLTLKNLRLPSFEDVETTANTLQRQARLGLAVLPVNGLTLAMDMDLDTVDLRDGLRRMFAIGGEGRLGSRFSVRSGVRWNLKGSRRPVGAVGASVGVRPGLWVEGHYAGGRADEDREFGVGLRAGF